MALTASTNDLDDRLSRLVSEVLSCKNRPAELNPTAMARQVEEAQVRLQMLDCMTHQTNKIVIPKGLQNWASLLLISTSLFLRWIYSKLICSVYLCLLNTGVSRQRTGSGVVALPAERS